MKRYFSSPIILLSLLTLLGAVLRFINLAWGQPFWFHPDERNIASAVVSLKWPDQMNPHFFAYGTVPIYLNFFLLQLLKPWFPHTDPFDIAIIIGRIFSALLSTALIPLTWYIAKRFLNLSTAYWVAFLTTFTTGFTQFAHYGTFEIWLTFFYVLLLFTLLNLSRQFSLKWLISSALIFGLAVGTKVTSLILSPAIFLALIWQLKSGPISLHLFLIRLIGLITQLLIFILITATIFFATNPYTLSFKPYSLFPKPSTLSQALNPEFLHSINVEGSIARGDIPVFYTRQFTDSNPLFSIFQVYPWALSWPVFVVGVVGLFWLVVSSIKSKQPIGIFIFFLFLIQFAFNHTLYVKWLRYTISSLPFLILGAAWFLAKIQQLSNEATLVRRSSSEGGKQSYRVLVFLCSCVLVLTLSWHLLQSLIFTTIYLQPDSRIAAARWLSQHYPGDTPILTEVWDIGIVPSNPHFTDIDLFNFYELDDPNLTSERQTELEEKLASSQIFIILSRRLWKNSLDHSDQYPHAAKFYQDLFSGALNFDKVAEFSNSPRLGPLTIPTELLAEETHSVFDHPTIQIWEKKL